MDVTFILTSLAILVTYIGSLLIVLTIFEYRKLAKLREDFETIKEDFKKDSYRMQKAIQRIIASYSVSDPDARISLINSALNLYPSVFNGYNALGYAYIEKGNITKAIDAFKDAIHHHPKDKEGYFDIAYAFLKDNKIDMSIEYLRKAIFIDSTSKDDLKENPLFSTIADDIRYKELIKLAPYQQSSGL